MTTSRKDKDTLVQFGICCIVALFGLPPFVPFYYKVILAIAAKNTPGMLLGMLGCDILWAICLVTGALVGVSLEKKWEEHLAMEATRGA